MNMCVDMCSEHLGMLCMEHGAAVRVNDMYCSCFDNTPVCERDAASGLLEVCAAGIHVAQAETR